jgi:hypothetical protein
LALEEQLATSLLPSYLGWIFFNFKEVLLLVGGMDFFKKSHK